MTVFVLYNGTENEIQTFFNIANRSHEHLKFIYEYSNREITFLDYTEIYKGSRFTNEGVLDIRTHIKRLKPFNTWRELAHILQTYLKLL